MPTGHKSGKPQSQSGRGTERSCSITVTINCTNTFTVRDKHKLFEQVSNLGIRNLDNAKLSFIFPIFVYVKSAVETAHKQGRDTKAHAHKEKNSCRN